MERKAAKGGWNGGSVPFGYLLNRETGFLERDPEAAPLIPTIFDLYLNQRLGARSIANWLNERGHRTHGGEPWSSKLLFTILRNRVYLGEVMFRDRWYPAPHPTLVEKRIFDAVQALLGERGEDHAKRRTNSSDYLLGGLLRCQSCGRSFLGTAATGNLYRYRYYTCYSRQHYGPSACDAQRIDADKLDQAVLNALLEAYMDGAPDLTRHPGPSRPPAERTATARGPAQSCRQRDQDHRSRPRPLLRGVRAGNPEGGGLRLPCRGPGRAAEGAQAAARRPASDDRGRGGRHAGRERSC
jgi:hypothetical protein